MLLEKKIQFKTYIFILNSISISIVVGLHYLFPKYWQNNTRPETIYFFFYTCVAFAHGL